MKRTLFLLLLLVLILLVHQVVRRSASQRLRLELADLGAQQARLLSQQEELERLRRALPQRLEVAPFVETLDHIARAAGVRQHQAETLAASGGRSPQRRKVGAAVGGVTSTQIKVEFDAPYRESAEYVRQLQNLSGYHRIQDVEMNEAGQGLHTTLKVELTAWKEGHAN